MVVFFLAIGALRKREGGGFPGLSQRTWPSGAQNLPAQGVDTHFIDHSAEP